MIGMVLVSHGQLAMELRKAMEHIVGPQQNCVTIAIEPDDDMEEKGQEILIATRNVDKGKGVIILTDLLGGTPSNLALSTIKLNSVDIIAGVNLPMLIKLSSVRQNLSLEQTIEAIEAAAKKYITVASKTLKA